MIKSSYFKSCGPKILTVGGFRSSAACGIDIPAIGSKIFIFGCKNKISKPIIMLNDINIGTGMVYYNKENLS